MRSLMPGSRNARSRIAIRRSMSRCNCVPVDTTGCCFFRQFVRRQHLRSRADRRIDAGPRCDAWKASTGRCRRCPARHASLRFPSCSFASSAGYRVTGRSALQEGSGDAASPDACHRSRWLYLTLAVSNGIRRPTWPDRLRKTGAGHVLATASTVPVAALSSEIEQFALALPPPETIRSERVPVGDLHADIVAQDLRELLAGRAHMGMPGKDARIGSDARSRNRRRDRSSPVENETNAARRAVLTAPARLSIIRAVDHQISSTQYSCFEAIMFSCG